jgi:hypothetical protein
MIPKFLHYPPNVHFSHYPSRPISDYLLGKFILFVIKASYESLIGLFQLHIESLSSHYFLHSIVVALLCDFLFDIDICVMT